VAIPRKHSRRDLLGISEESGRVKRSKRESVFFCASSAMAPTKGMHPVFYRVVFARERMTDNRLPNLTKQLSAKISSRQRRKTPRKPSIRFRHHGFNRSLANNFRLRNRSGASHPLPSSEENAGDVAPVHLAGVIRHLAGDIDRPMIVTRGSTTVWPAASQFAVSSALLRPVSKITEPGATPFTISRSLVPELFCPVRQPWL